MPRTFRPRDIGGVRRNFNGPQGKPVEVWIPDGVRAGDELRSRRAFSRRRVDPGLSRRRAGNKHRRGGRQSRRRLRHLRSLVLRSRRVRFAAGGCRRAKLAAVVAPLARTLTLVGFSAGHGAVRAILREPRHFARVDAVLLLDGMHTSYVPEGTVLANGGTLDTTNLVAFVAFARAAMRGEKRFLVTHSEIFPGTFASTTETADWLLHALGLQRTPVLRGVRAGCSSSARSQPAARVARLRRKLGARSRRPVSGYARVSRAP